MKKLLGFLGGALLLSQVHGQNIKPLSLGDTLQQFVINHVVNWKDSVITLRKNGKAAVIDFFETHCGGCIELLPYLNKLYQAKKDSLSVFVVADEPSDVIKRFLKTNPNAKNISLPFVTGDTLLNKLFKHHSIPHEVWIGKDRTVKAITASDYITENNIEKLCEGKPLHLPIKNDYFVYDPNQPLSDYANADRFITSSTFTGYVDNLPKFYHSSIKLADSIHKKVFFINIDLLSLVNSLFDNKYTPDRFILDVNDSDRLLNLNNNPNDDWYINNSYCYELIVSDTMSDSVIRNRILNDIRNSLHFNIQIAPKLMPCYKLIKTDNGSIKPETKGGRKSLTLFPKTGLPIVIHNNPVSAMVTAMNDGYYGHEVPIVIDSTNDSACVDLKLPISDIHDISGMDKALRPYGYEIVKTHQLIDMVLISDYPTVRKD